MTDHTEFLRKVPLFAELSHADLVEICAHVDEVRLKAGQQLFSEGEAGQKAYVIKEGQIEIYKTSEGRNIQLAIRQPGEVIGELSLLETTPRSASGKALADSLLIGIGQAQFEQLLTTSPSASRIMLHTVTTRLRSTELALRQSEKMAQLGTMTAGIAHELNNPAAAARRGADQLGEQIEQLLRVEEELFSHPLSASQKQFLHTLAERTRQNSAQPVMMDSLERSDREAQAGEWLAEVGIETPWELAPLAVDLGYTAEDVGSFRQHFPGELLPVFLRWLSFWYAASNLLQEISQGAGRISEIVKALKAYVYLDQAPIQEVDVHEGLENTLVILRHKLNRGVEVRRAYAPDLPKIQAYGSELNQVWTNLIDNAIDATDGHGKITLTTCHDAAWVVVEVADDGPGISAEVQSKLFNPFFTTKPLGKGAGLGLNTSYNIVHKHGGEIKVSSHPGETRFTVWLPVK